MAYIKSLNSSFISCTFSELYKSNPTTDTAETLYEVASSFLTMQAEVDVESEDIDTNKLRVLPELCYRLANQAVTICSPGEKM